MRTYEKWQSSQNLAQVSLKNASLKVDMKPNLITATNQDTLKILILSTIFLAKQKILPTFMEFKVSKCV